MKYSSDSSNNWVSETSLAPTVRPLPGHCAEDLGIHMDSPEDSASFGALRCQTRGKDPLE